MPSSDDGRPGDSHSEEDPLSRYEDELFNNQITPPKEWMERHNVPAGYLPRLRDIYNAYLSRESPQPGTSVARSRSRFHRRAGTIDRTLFGVAAGKRPA
jgi:hypothetical protein